MSQVLYPSLSDKASEALARHDWNEAFDLLSAADAERQLSPDELELLAQAAWWVGKLPVAIETRERSYAAYAKAGDDLRAAMAAILLGENNLLRNAHSVAKGWLSRADRLLEPMEENPAHGWLAAIRALQAILTGEIDEALAHASRAHEIGSRFGDRDLEALGLVARGVALVAVGQAKEGLASIDEATVAAVGGELEPLTAGTVYCTNISTCTALGDMRRALEWTEAQDRWCKREHINGYPGMCRLYRAEIKRFHGSWLEAEAEARRASEELRGFVPAAVGQALYEIGEIRLRRGDLPTAEDALLRAHSYGRDPEPALSLVRLAHGNVAAAAASIRRALNEPPSLPSWFAPPGTDLYRLSLLPAHVEISLAAADVQSARSAAEELASIAERLDSPAARASATSALGAVLLAEGEAAEAAQSLRDALRLWTDLDAPYEGARTRMTLAQAYAAKGEPGRASMELGAARAAFERLGAALDRRRAEEALAAVEGAVDVPPVRTAGERATRAFVFTDIVDSTKLAELLGDDAWNNLIRWHDETIRSLVAQYGGEEIKGTGDGFFLAFENIDRAIECSIAMQRRLAEHRRAHGFAPAVRIGVHWAEARRTGLDYIGNGVNVAARVGGRAGGGEILVSAPTLSRSGRQFAAARSETVELKGLSAPVEVVSVDWR